MKLRKILFAIVAAITMTGCYNDTYQDLYVSPSAPDVCDTVKNPATYSNNVRAILTNKCATAGCHNSTTLQSGYDFSSYSGAQSSANFGSLVNVVAVSRNMPPSGPLTDCEIKQIVYWVNKGALNN